MKNILKLFIGKSLVVIVLLFPFFCFAQTPLQQTVINDGIEKQDVALANEAGFNLVFFLGDAVDTVIEGFLGLLGVIFVILIIISGFNWMTAGGDEAKVEKAKKTINRAIIGLIVIVVSYAITYFVFNALDSAVG